jgi:glycosyltransferase involved in cell wall biosynthesis
LGLKNRVISVNSKNKLNVFHFSVASEGGVHAVIKNIIQYSNNDNISYHVLYLTNSDSTPEITPLENVHHSFIQFSKNDNLYHVFRKINRCIKGNNIVLACHDWTELAMVSQLGLSYPVVYFLHGDYEYYYETALKNQGAVSFFVAPTLSIYKRLLNLMPQRKADIVQLFYPIYTKDKPFIDSDKISCAYYVANLTDDNKNFQAIPIIDKILVDRGIHINWNIAGAGLNQDEFIKCWDYYQPDRIKYFGYLNQKDLSNYIQSSNIFILPSKVEGLPISLIESMKSGLVPIVNAWNDSVFEYVQNEKNGFLIKDLNLHLFAEKLILLHNDMNLLKQMRENAKTSTSSKNDVETSILSIENIFFVSSDKAKNRSRKKIYGSRLDHPLIPNQITKMIRKTLA